MGAVFAALLRRFSFGNFLRLQLAIFGIRRKGRRREVAGVLVRSQLGGGVDGFEDVRPNFDFSGGLPLAGRRHLGSVSEKKS